MKKLMTILSVLFVFTLLTGCMQSESKVKKNTEATAKELLKAKPEKTNTKLKALSVYVPETVLLKDDLKTNAVLEGIGGTYLLFVNPQEDSTSDMNYKLLKDQKGDKEIFVDITEQTDAAFNYLLVLKNKDKLYEISAGVGGHKISAVVKKSKLEKTINEMIPIIKSLEIKEEAPAK